MLKEERGDGDRLINILIKQISETLLTTKANYISSFNFGEKQTHKITFLIKSRKI